MSRISIPTREEAPSESRPLLDGVNARLGFIPNTSRLLALSPHALGGFTGLQNALGKTLDLETRNAIALSVSEANGCNYCRASHCYVASRIAKTTADEIALNRQGESKDPRIAAVARFAAQVVEKRGHISDEDFRSIQQAGYTAPQIVEIVVLVAQFSLTNLVNNVFGTEIDFELAQPAA